MVLAGFLGEVGSWTQVVLGVGLLVFIHEMGHFLVAKWAGVRVLVFSLGFGPELTGFTRGPTRYRVSLVPLGGYVKMSGETELPEGGYAPDDYPAQPVWKRSLIIIAGVAMNALLGFLLYAAAVLVGMKVEPVVVGTVRHGGPAWEAGIRSGDRILSADGRRLVAFPDLIYATMDGDPLDLEVVRSGRTLHVPVKPRPAEGEKTPTIGVGAGLGSTLETVPPHGSTEKAGLRKGDRIVAIEGIPGDLSLLNDDLFVEAVLPAGGPLQVSLVRPPAVEPVVVSLPPKEPAPKEPVRRIGIARLRTTVDMVRPGGPAEAAGWRVDDRPVAVAGRPVRGAISFLREVLRAPAGEVKVRVARESGETDLVVAASDRGTRLETLRDIRFANSASPTAVEVLPEGPPGPGGRPAPSPAEAAGIPSGARITEVDGATVTEFKDAVKRITDVKEGAIEIAWTADAGKGRASIVPAPYGAPGLYGLDFTIERSEEELSAGSPLGLVSLAAGRCVATTRQILTTIAGIFRGSLDKNNLGGPILIAQVAHQTSKAGFGQFLWLLAMLSINLMFLNVLPIPLLDGGQLALLGVEAATRRAPSEAVVGIAQMVGLAFLLGLMLFISFNDVLRLVH
jgi:regulator of sigma E protease